LPHLLRHRLRTLLTFLAITLGVAGVCALDLVSGSVVRATDQVATGLSGRAQLTVSNADIGVPEALLERLRAIDGVGAAVPVEESGAAAVRFPGERLDIFGIDLVDDQSVRAYDLAGARDG